VFYYFWIICQGKQTEYINWCVE